MTVNVEFKRKDGIVRDKVYLCLKPILNNNMNDYMQKSIFFNII